MLRTLTTVLPITLCFGCGAALLGLASSSMSPSDIDLTTLEKTTKELDDYFDANIQIFENASATIKSFSTASSTFGLTSEEYQSLATSVTSETAFVMPERFSTKQATELKAVAQNTKTLRTALMTTGQRSKATASFIVEKTKALEGELIRLKTNHEVIKRNHLASRRDKNRANNQIRKANKLVEASKRKVIGQQQKLAKLQAESIYALKSLVGVLKSAGAEQTASAISGIKASQKSAITDKSDALQRDALDQAEGTVDRMNGALNEQGTALNPLIDKAKKVHADANQKGSQLDKKLKKAAKNSEKVLKSKVDTAEQVLSEKIEEVTDDGKSNTPSSDTN